MSENTYVVKPPEVYEEYTQSERGSICPLRGTECVKDPQLCRFWQPFLIVRETILHTYTSDDIYMCLFDIMRTSFNNVLLLLQGQVAMNVGRAGMTGAQDKQQPG